MRDLIIQKCVGSRLALVRAWWRLILGSRVSMGRDVRIYENVKLAVESEAHLVLGDEAAIMKGAVVSVRPRGKMEIGARSYIGEYCVLMADSSIQIGHDVMIAPHCTIVDYNHIYRSATELMRPDRVEVKPVLIHDNVWIGAGCQILLGVTIGEGAVIGAGSVITRDVPPYAVMIGSPASVLRYRE